MRAKRYTDLDQLTDHQRSRIDALGITTRVWSGVLIFDCPQCHYDNQDPGEVIYHMTTHGPTVRPATRPAEALILDASGAPITQIAVPPAPEVVELREPETVDKPKPAKREKGRK